MFNSEKEAIIGDALRWFFTLEAEYRLEVEQGVIALVNLRLAKTYSDALVMVYKVKTEEDKNGEKS